MQTNVIIRIVAASVIVFCCAPVWAQSQEERQREAYLELQRTTIARLREKIDALTAAHDSLVDERDDLQLQVADLQRQSQNLRAEIRKLERILASESRAKAITNEQSALGLTARAVDDLEMKSLIASLGSEWATLFPKTGVLVGEVLVGSTADQAGLQSLDVIQSIEGTAIKTHHDLIEVIHRFAIDSILAVDLMRPHDGGARVVWTNKRVFVRTMAASELETLASGVAHRPPLRFVSASIARDILDTPIAHFVVENTSAKIVDAFEVTIYCFNRFGDPVEGFLDDSIVEGIAQRTILPGEDKEFSFRLIFRATASKIRVVLKRVHMTDGSVWKPLPDQEVVVEGRTDG